MIQIIGAMLFSTLIAQNTTPTHDGVKRGYQNVPSAIVKSEVFKFGDEEAANSAKHKCNHELRKTTQRIQGMGNKIIEMKDCKLVKLLPLQDGGVISPPVLPEPSMTPDEPEEAFYGGKVFFN